jgi:hypothetical protein
MCCSGMERPSAGESGVLPGVLGEGVADAAGLLYCLSVGWDAYALDEHWMSCMHVQQCKPACDNPCPCCCCCCPHFRRRRRRRCCCCCCRGWVPLLRLLETVPAYTDATTISAAYQCVESVCRCDEGRMLISHQCLNRGRLTAGVCSSQGRLLSRTAHLPAQRTHICAAKWPCAHTSVMPCHIALIQV